MYKSKLQELCQRQNWELPEYAAAKDGPDHMPRFTATVTVCGQVFETPGHCKSSKEAQNTAAQVAFDFLTAPPPAAAAAAEPSPPPAAVSEALLHVAATPMIQPLAIAADPPPLPLSPLAPYPSSLPDPRPGLLATKCSANSTKPVKEELFQESIDDQSQCSVDNKIATGSECKEVLHMYKNLLQQHAQKENAGFPVYTSESEGPPHARRFKSKVSLNGKSYETSEFFTTLKEAEQTAAKIACQALSVGVIQEEKGLYKNLLQELVQKKGLKCPSYETVSSGLSHKPVFVSTVEVGSESFRSVECKTRKLAEMNAAEVAYCALTKGNPPTNSSKVPPTNTPSFADNLPQNIQPTATTQKHQTSIDEEDHVLAKRAKASPGNMDVNAHLQSNPPSNLNPENSTPAQHVPGATADNKPSVRSRTPRKLKRAKASPGNMDVNAHLQSNPPSNSNPENSTPAQHVPGATADNKPSVRSRTVVFPRKLNWPIPENAIVMPFSDEKWVAYTIEVDQNPTLSS